MKGVLMTSMFLAPDKKSYIPIVYTTKDGKEITLTIDDIKRFLVRGNPEAVTIQELVFFAGVCRARGMDPYAGDCYLIKYGKTDSAAIVTARGYFEARAKAQKDCKGWAAGIIVVTEEGEGPEVYRNGALPRPGDRLIGGWFKGHSDKWDIPLELEADLQMYIKKTREGHVTKFWALEKQAHMIRKVALVQGLRELWPNEFAGLYAPEEMGPETVEPKAITLTESEVTEVVDPMGDLKADLEKKKEEPPEKDEAAESELAEKKARELTAYNRAIVKTFDAKTAAVNLSAKQVNDYLFTALEKAGEGTTIADLKIQAVEKGILAGLVTEMVEFFAEKPAVKAKEEEVTPALVLADKATLGTDAAVIIKKFKMQKATGFFGNLKIYEAEKHLWPLEAQVEYAQKIKDMRKKLPERFQEAWDEIHPAPSAAAAPGPATKPCDKCGEPAEGALCPNCQKDEQGETDKSAFFGFLENMGAMKNKLVAAFGKDEGEGKYYALLGAHGFEKSNEITERDKQIEVYKEMGDLLK
jgi:phage recombination protein Bet